MIIKPAELIIEDFRNFKNVNIPICKKITVISGVNGVGKSNILSLIASGSGINKKSDLGSNFQPEFYDFFNIDAEESYSQYKLYIKYNTEDGQLAVTKRLSFKDDTKTKRGIRIIPRTSNKFLNNVKIDDAEKKAREKYGVGGSARVPIPTIYLSLSRVYPLGERKEQTQIKTFKKSKKNQFAKKETKELYRLWYNTIIPGSIKENAEISIIKKAVCPRSSLHMDMDNTPSLSQSIGQDNIGNIVSALIDIYLLSQEKDYKGALLCIDEIEVSLHPDSQIRLFELLIELCEKLSMQLIVSTHSLTILQESLKREEKNQDDFKVIYLQNPSMPMVASRKSYYLLKADLFNKMSYVKIKPRIYFEDIIGQEVFHLLVSAINRVIKDLRDSEKVKTLRNYCEDKYSIIIQKLSRSNSIEKIEENIKQIVTHCGCEELFDLFQADLYFKRIILLLDGDARIKEKNLLPNIIDYLDNDFDPKEKQINDRKHEPNILFFPSYFAPESFLYRIIYQVCKKQMEYIDFWRGLSKQEETALYTADKISYLFAELPPSFKNNDLKKIFGDDLETGAIWRFIRKTDIVAYYYLDFNTMCELLDWGQRLLDAYNMTYSLTVENRYV